MSIIRWLYGIQDTPPKKDRYDLVVPLDYGVLPNSHNPLPDATKQCLQQAVEMLFKGKAREIVWGSTDYFGPGAQDIDRAKQLFVASIGFCLCPRYTVSSNNSIQEASNIHEILPNVKRILIICDWPHARRARIIWKHFFPNAEIGIMSVSAKWDEGHPSYWQKSLPRWIQANILHHILIRLRGVSKLTNMVHHIDS